MIEAWRNLFKPHILERGMNYYEEGAVSSLEETDTGYRAVVDGSDSYSVEIEIHNDRVEDMFCECPYAEDGNYCKHMAAVLYEIEGGKQEVAHRKSISEKIDESRQELQDVVNKIPEEQLRKLVMSLAWNDNSLRSLIFTQYTEEITEKQILQLKREVDRIVYENSDRGDFVDYYHASDYIDELNAFLDEKVQALIDKKCYMQAFELTNYVFHCVGNQEMDDSDGGSTWVANNCYEYWQQILDECSEEEQKQMFQWFQTHQNGYVIDYMEEYISDFLMEEFHDAELLHEKLKALDEQIEKFGKGTDCGAYYSVHYGYVNNIMKRIQIMEELNYSEQAIKEYREKFRQFSEIRKLEVQEYLNKKDYEKAISVLKESKELDKEYWGLVSGYSKQLIDIYKKLEWKKEYRQELEYQIFDCAQSDLEYVKKLKELCGNAEWEEYREKILQANTTYSIRYLFLESEGLYERLLEEIISSGSLYALDQYEKVLKKTYPENTRDAYISFIRSQASSVSDRKRYKELVKYLKKIAKYPGGSSCAKEIAADWRVMYHRRSAMMDELEKAGF